MPSSRGSSWPRDRIRVSHVSGPWQAGSIPLAPPGKSSFSQTLCPECLRLVSDIDIQLHGVGDRIMLLPSADSKNKTVSPSTPAFYLRAVNLWIMNSLQLILNRISIVLTLATSRSRHLMNQISVIWNFFLSGNLLEGMSKSPMISVFSSIVIIVWEFCQFAMIIGEATCPS